jgi:hypothetical protein
MKISYKTEFVTEIDKLLKFYLFLYNEFSFEKFLYTLFNIEDKNKVNLRWERQFHLKVIPRICRLAI